MTRILGIESSCDETAAAVVEDRTLVRSSIVASQVELHSRFGGVVPEIAARRHLEAIRPTIEKALTEGESDWETIDAIAVTQGPGLVGALLVGVSTAKALAWQLDKPLLAVNHLEGHVRSVFIEHAAIEFPALALVVSGGHTSLYLCPREGDYRRVARTRDDAAGEAFDKVAKLLGLGYPGGPIIERLAADGDASAHIFPQAQMKDGSMDFSFSGLKTAVRREAQRLGLDRSGNEASQAVRDLAASFQRAAVTVLVRRTLAVARRERVRSLLVTGGVACNGALRRAFEEATAESEISLHLPSPRYTTDNAAMIAAAGFLHYEAGRFADTSLNADPNLRL